MKTNFKKLASSAAVTAVLATGSMSAHAIITDVPGEAYLVPFAVATVGDATDSPFGALDTVVRIVVPASIGRDTVFDYTAPHTAPTNPVAGGNTELPEAAALKSGNYIHWTFLNSKSEHVINGDFPVTADDVAVFDWHSIVRQNAALLNGVAGYLVFQTEAGWQGQDADFSFFADAYFVTDSRTNRDRDSGAYNDYFGSVSIPALPMADGADAGQTAPNMGNNVIVDGSTLGVDASPLASGIRTSVPGATDEITILDLELAASSRAQDAASLMVVWGDTNAATWKTVGYQAYDADENPCSGTLSLPNELNLLWSVASRERGGMVSAQDHKYDMPTPEFVTAPGNGGQVVNLCNPNTVAISSFTEDRLSGGFVKLRLNEPSNTRQHSAAAFTINFSSTVDPDTGFHAFATETVLGHDRGKFNKNR